MSHYIEHDGGIQANYRHLINRVVRIHGASPRDAIVGTLEDWEPVGPTKSRATIIRRGGRQRSIIGGVLLIEPVRPNLGEYVDLLRSVAAQEYILTTLLDRHQQNEQGFCRGCGWGWPCPDAVILGSEDSTGDNEEG